MGNTKSKALANYPGKAKALREMIVSSLSRQSVFAFFWGFGHLVDAFRQPSVLASADLESASHVIVFGLAVWLLMKPSSTTRLTLLAGFNLIEAILAMPVMPNHKMIFFMVDAAIVLSVAIYAFSSRRDLGTWFARTEPFLRMALFVTYGSATLAKLNSGWFDLSVSCAVTMPAREFAFLNDILGLQIPWNTFWFMPFIVAGAEIIIWTSVLFPQARPFGLVLAVLFHLSLSLTPISQGLGFSFLLFPLLVLYLPNNAHDQVHSLGTRFVEFLKRKGLLIPGAYALIAFSVFLGYISLLSPDQGDREIQATLRYLPALTLLIIFAAAIAYLALRHRNAEQVKNPIGVPTVAHWLLLALVVANSLAPYVGVKTYATMTMYSNLQMENGKSNHFLIPRIPVDMPVDDQVTVLKTSNAEIARIYKSGLRLTWHEFQRILSDDPWAQVTFERDGVRYELENARDLEGLTELSPMHKWTAFRFVADDPVCLW